MVSMLLDRELAEDQAVVTDLPGRRRSLLAHSPLCPSGIIHRLYRINPG